MPKSFYVATRIKTNVVQSQDVKIHGYLFSNKKMLCTNFDKSYLLVVMASYVSKIIIH